MYFLATAEGGTNDSTSFFFHIFFDSILFLFVIQPYATNYTKLNYLIWDTIIKDAAHPLGPFWPEVAVGIQVTKMSNGKA